VDQIKFGLKEFDEDKKQTFLYLLKSPFIKVKRIGSDELFSINEKPANEKLIEYFF